VGVECGEKGGEARSGRVYGLGGRRGVGWEGGGGHVGVVVRSVRGGGMRGGVRGEGARVGGGRRRS